MNTIAPIMCRPGSLIQVHVFRIIRISIVYIVLQVFLTALGDSWGSASGPHLVFFCC
jgi:hypothetical protein